MENKDIIQTMKELVQKAKEEQDKQPHHISVEIAHALISAGLIDEDGNIINEPEETGKER